MGFVSCDWSEAIQSDEPTTKKLFEPDEVALEEEFHSRGPIPIPVSADGGKTLDWSRSAESEGSSRASIYSGPMVHRER